MIKKLLFCIAILLPGLLTGAQDSYNDRVQKYVQHYYAQAMAEQVRSGVPAAVTLGQGILETEAGCSELMTKANNHFGIKCKSDWQGEYFLHDDDLPQERFKKYTCADESYKDHSDYLKRNARYARLFKIPVTDYAAWARGLKSCGYATNPQYASRLIKIIETFNLQDYTLAAVDGNRYKIPTQTTEGGDMFAMVAMKDTQVHSAPLTASIARTPLYVRKQAADTAKKTAAAQADAVKPAPSPFDRIKGLSDSAHHSIIVKEEPTPERYTFAARPKPLADTSKAQLAAKADTLQKMPPAADIRYDSGKIITVNGLKAFYAYKDEMLLQYAVKYNIRYPRLLEFNDLPDAPLPANMLIYTERKLASGTHARHTVKEGENMMQISQNEGIQMKRLMTLNKMEPGDEPAAGVVMELQTEAAQRPKLRANTAAAKKDPVVTRPKPSDDFITITRPVHADTPKVEAPVAKAVVAAVVPVAIKDTARPVTIVKKIQDSVVAPADTAMADTTPMVRPVLSVANDSLPPVTAGRELQMTDTSASELDRLKKELDRVVYADDSKLISTAPVKAADTKKQDAARPATKEPKKAAAKDNGKYYTVKKGDTLSGIAKKNKVTIKQLQKWNDIDPDDLSLGQKLRVKP